MNREEILSRSDALHERVQRFALANDGDSFDAIACDIARFQADAIPGYRRLADARGSLLDDASALPAVPTDAFRLTRVAVHDSADDVTRFVSSGTTAEARSVHALRRTDTLERLALSWGRKALVPHWPARRVVIALAPHPGAPATSSLGFMMRSFIASLDGRALAADPAGAAFDPDSSARWLASPQGLDAEGVRRAALVALERQEPLLVLATSFALVALLDGLGGERLRAPKNSVVMQTGGFKGRTRTVSPGALSSAIARAFGIDEARIVGEYGMTELSSQAYEGTLADAELSGPPSVYLPPPWLRIHSVDPVRLIRLPPGEVGLARFVDLANVDSAVCIVTKDLVREVDGGVELIGRSPGAPLRGCSLTLEQLLPGKAAGGAA
ncbi:MAG: acyl-protein synthetase [Polyangiaceae bacterium]|nr:acyl-protein synthetase [Polyangiaceae bacterium]